MDLRQRVQASLTGTYTLERELGGGGMARVFVASEHRFGRKVVVKVLAPELAASISTGRFEREIQLAASLQQANIVPVLAAGETEGLPYYTMPYVEGESLRARLGRGAVPIAEAIAILRDVARALAYAHERGVVHRDIKPDNILLSGGTAVVTDFGIAKAIADAAQQAPGATLTQLGTAVGTPAYMAPEQAAGDPATDHRADLYAFGCTAYELLAGHAPFHGMSPHKLMVAHISEVPTPIGQRRPDCPPSLARLVTQCLQKEPAQRPASADEMIRTLDAAATSSHGDGPALLLGGRGMLVRALAIYATAFLIVALGAFVLVDQLGLPAWVFGGALVVMALGLPVILFTGYSQYVTRRLATATPTLTPRGSYARPSAQGTLAGFAVRASPHVSWARAARGGALAVGLFALLVVGFLTMRKLGIGPAGSLLAAGKLEAQDRVLVAGFEGTGADSSLAAVISEAVRTNLSQSRAVQVVPTSSIVAALQRMQRPDTTSVTLALAREIAVREGIKAVVTGSVAAAGSGYILTARLVHAESGDELASYHEAADDTGEIIEAVDRLTRKLRGRIGESLKDVRDAPSLAQVTTPSLGALQAYAQGLRANDIEGDYPRAVRHFEDAIARDSNFAAAYVQLSHSLGNGRIQLARRDTLLRRAFELRHRLPERERYAVEGAYYTSPGAADRPRAIAAFERAVALDSANADAANSLAIGYNTTRDYARAEQAYRIALRAEPGNGIIAANLIGTLFNAGKLDAADSLLVAMRAQKIPYPTWRRAVEVQYLRGNLDSATRLIDAALQTQTGSQRAQAASIRAGVARIRGQLQLAARMSLESARLGAAASPADTGIPPQIGLDLAGVEGWYRGNRARGLAILDSVLRASPIPADAQDANIEVATIFALLGDGARARRHVARFDSAIAQDSTLRRRIGHRRYDALGEIALLENRPREAVELFRKADVASDGLPTSCLGCADILVGRAFDAAAMPDSARLYYERYVTGTGTARYFLDPWFYAPTLKRLGELYEQGRDYERAAEYYARFLEVWKDPDPELQPRVAEVRTSLARVSRLAPR